MEMSYLNKPRSFVKNFHFCNFAMIIEQEFCLTDGLSVKHVDVKDFHGKKGTVLGVQSVEQSVRHSPSYGAKGRTPHILFSRLEGLFVAHSNPSRFLSGDTPNSQGTSITPFSVHHSQSPVLGNTVPSPIAFKDLPSVLYVASTRSRFVLTPKILEVGVQHFPNHEYVQTDF